MPIWRRPRGSDGLATWQHQGGRSNCRRRAPRCAEHVVADRLRDGRFRAGAAPLDVPPSGVLLPGDALRAGDWLLYPSLRTFSAYSDNLLQSPVSPIATAAFGIDPGLVAEWTNGIHSTTLYGNAEGRAYTSASELNAFDQQAGVVQKYAPLPDLIFSAQGDYTHRTWATGLINGIPSPIGSPGTNILSNGNTVLPNGNIISPTGQIVGQVGPGLSVANPTTVINPNDQFTGTASVEKFLNGGFIGLTASIARTDYQNTLLNPDFTVKTFGGSGSFSLGPMFYVYSNGAVAMYADASAFTAVGGIGTRQIGEFRGSAYFGRQGSEVQNSGSAGGNIYGGRFSYYPTPDLTVTLGFDELENISSQTGTSNLALNFPTQSVLVIPIGASTRISDYSLQIPYTISNQWSLFTTFSYMRSEYLGSSRVDNAAIADAVLRYAMTRALMLAWEYQYSTIISNAPFVSSNRNAVIMSATYNF